MQKHSDMLLFLYEKGMYAYVHMYIHIFLNFISPRKIYKKPGNSVAFETCNHNALLPP